MGRLPRPTGKEMLRFLERQGFICVRITGSHHHMEKGSLRCSVPAHGNDDLIRLRDKKDSDGLFK